MSKTFRAVYKDAQGKTFSAPVVQIDGAWLLVTTSGLTPITHSLDNEEYGVVVFDSYREVEPEQLHVEAGSSWADHKQAFAQQELAQQRKDRVAARDQLQTLPVNHKQAAQIAAARDHRQQIAAAMRPNGTGAGLIIEKD